PDKTPFNSPPNPLWSKISQELRLSLGDKAHDLWFTDFRLASVSEEEILLMAPGTMYAIWVEENFKKHLISAFEKHLGNCGRIRFLVDESATLAKDADEESAEDESESREGTTRLAPRILVEKVSEKKLLERGFAAGLVENYRFENFVPGENSELAWAAARAVADQPGKTYQPLFFHSASGLGKTHLLHGIGWESLRQ